MRNSLIAGAAAALMMTVASAALAQDQPQPAPAPAPAPAAAPAAPQQPQLPSFDQPEWTKVCAQNSLGKESCQTVRDLLAPNAAWTMTAQVGQEKGGKPTFSVIVPAGVVLPLGARVMADGQTVGTAKYRICNGPSCVADMPLTDANLAAIKKGKKLTVQAITYQGQAMALDIGLDGFGKAFDGQGIDSPGYQAKQKAYGEKLKAAFQPLIDAQQKAQQQQKPQGAAPPAPPAPAQ